MPEVKIPDKLLPLLETKKRIKLVVGGRGGAKTISMSDILLMMVAHGAVVCCAREHHNSIDDSVHSTLENEIRRLDMPGFTVQRDKIFHESGGEVFYKGLARNPGNIKSLREVDVLWVEEAEYTSSKSLELLTPSVRSVSGDKMPEIWFSMNRGSSADPIAIKYLKRADKALMTEGIYEDDLMLAIQINYDDNPWFTQELEIERLDDLENKSRAFYRHKWYGEYNDEVENSIISAEEFDAAIDAHKKLGFKPRGKKIVAFDPADEGGDAKGLSIRHGSVVLDVLQSDIGDVNDGCDWATDFAIQKGAHVFIWDADGLGLSLRRQVSDGFKGFPVEQQAFRGGRTPDRPDSLYEPLDDNSARAMKNKDAFKNQRAQYYWALRDRFYKTYRAVEHGEYYDPDELISISSSIKDLDMLRSEVCRIPRKGNGTGMIQIMTKSEMLKIDIKSPNMADTLMMSMAIPDRIGKKRQSLKVKKVSIA